eukprot:c6647_g1_i1.p1 GENE.c6647_g1_i1~~c6647_g1_i1.p1  ORF type:complete len:241 (+),score=76.87 c6647_g1_i1:3-725(+)
MGEYKKKERKKSMFVLIVCEDQIRIVPNDFEKERIQAITETINSKYGNKIFPNAGLGIALYDILKVGDAYIYPGDGAAHIKCTFRFIVFKPFIDEVLVGKIVSSSIDGIRVSLGFFDNIRIPPEMMNEQSEFNQEQGIWMWKYDDHDLPMYINDDIRFRVRAVEYNTSLRDKTQTETKPAPVIARTGIVDLSKKVLDQEKEEKELQILSNDIFGESHMKINASLNEDGLGMCVWWQKQGL